VVGQADARERFAREFEARFHRAPEWQDALGFEAARALLAAIEKAGTNDREAVRQALGDLRMESLLPGGYLRFPKEYGQQARYRPRRGLPRGAEPARRDGADRLAADRSDGERGRPQPALRPLKLYRRTIGCPTARWPARVTVP
jgi:hypothetical protein